METTLLERLRNTARTLSLDSNADLEIWHHNIPEVSEAELQRIKPYADEIVSRILELSKHLQSVISSRGDNPKRWTELHKSLSAYKAWPEAPEEREIYGTLVALSWAHMHMSTHSMWESFAGRLATKLESQLPGAGVLWPFLAERIFAIEVING